MTLKKLVDGRLAREDGRVRVPFYFGDEEGEESDRLHCGTERKGGQRSDASKSETKKRGESSELTVWSGGLEE